MVVKAVSGGTFVPADGAVVTDGSVVTLKTAAGGDFPGSPVTGTTDVAGGSLTQMLIPANEIVLKDQQTSVNVSQYDSTGSFAATVAVATNVLTLTLANATTRIAVNALPITVKDAANHTAAATIAVSGGAFGQFPLTNGTQTIVSHNQALTGVAPTGTYTNTVTFTVAGGVITGIALS